MLVTLQRDVFDRMNDGELISACFGPLILAYKEVSSRGGDLSDFYQKMSSGQQTLFVYRTYYSHAIESVQELYWWSAFFLAQEARWAALNEQMRLLGDLEFISLLQDMEGMLRTRSHPIPLADFSRVSRNDLDSDAELRVFFQSAYERLTQVTVRTNELLAASIRQSPGLFVTWTAGPLFP